MKAKMETMASTTDGVNSEYSSDYGAAVGADSDNIVWDDIRDRSQQKRVLINFDEIMSTGKVSMIQEILNDKTLTNREKCENIHDSLTIGRRKGFESLLVSAFRAEKQKNNQN